MFTSKIKELFKMDNEMGWSFYCASLDTLDDSMTAIVAFKDNRIEPGSPSKIGIEYLLLYGVLNAVYVNYGAIITLSDLVKIKNKSIIEDFKSLDISFLRNAVAAHPTNFKRNDGKISIEPQTVTNYRITRGSLNNSGNLELLSASNKFININIYNAVDQYIKFAEDVLFKICKKLIKLRHSSSKSKMQNLLTELDEIALYNKCPKLIN